ncbi:universal stress protein [Amphritea balenae]|uniref:Universal stress protein n=1 Tax=Amphritea balenae TaxID=452629 RepID=A0A3P1SP63_9GAMM|nr:universal stress protein [Amphritea balenae]RRC98923.1 universal stress protein [Amphritea balenae]GGK62917.1 universal stress protein [Amphritea balenae]
MFKKVLVPVDLTEPEFIKQALKLALREVRDNDAELHLITVVPGFSNSFVASFFSESEHKKAVTEVARKFKKFAVAELPDEVKPVLKVYEGSPAELIVDYVKRKQIDLVLMSAHHRNPVDEFLLGSVSARVAERSTCSVLLLKN